PPDPGNVSAFGLLTVDVKNDYVVTAVQRDEALDLERVNAIYARLGQQAVHALAAEGFAAADMRLVRSADLRYFGQAWEVRVEVFGSTTVVFPGQLARVDDYGNLLLTRVG